MMSLTVAAAQVPTRACAVDENLAAMQPMVRAAAVQGARLLVFAEAMAHAYCLVDDSLALAEPLDGGIVTTWRRWAQEHELTLLAGMFERAEQAVYNSLVCCHPDGLVQCQRKQKLTEAEIAAGVVPGSGERLILDVDGWRVAPVICAEASIDGLSDRLRTLGVDLIALATGGGGLREQMLEERDLVTDAGWSAFCEDRTQVFIAEPRCEYFLAAGCGFVSANLVGPDGRGQIHRGHCMIVDAMGVPRAQVPGTNVLEHQQAGLIVSTLTRRASGAASDGDAE